MMRLVGERSKKLDVKQTGQLMEVIDQSIRKDNTFFQGCQWLRELLKGKHWNNLRSRKRHERDQAEMVVNLCHSHIRTLVPTLFFQDPYIETSSDNPHYKDSAPVWEALINLVLRRINYKKETKRQVLDMATYPEGWKKWFIVKPETSEGVELGTEKIEKTDKTASSGPLTEAGGASGPPSWSVNGAPACARIPSQQMIIDYVSSDRSLETARFVAVRYRKLRSELLADPRYKKAVIEKKGENAQTYGGNTVPPLKGGSVTNNRDSAADFWKNDGIPSPETGDEFETVYEVWVYQLVELGLYKQMVVLMEGCDEPIRDPEGWEEYLGPHVSRYPFTRGVLNEVPDELPTSELGAWHTLQSGLNYLMTKLMSMVSAQRQIVAYNPSELKNPNKAKETMLNGPMRALVETTGDPTNVFAAVQNPPISQDHYQLVQLVHMFMQQVSGFGQNRRGGTGARTATEASLIEQGTQIKTDEKTDVVADVIKEDAEIVIGMLRHLVPAEFVFQAVGETGGIKWHKFSRFDGSWSPDVIVRPNSFRKATQRERVGILSMAHDRMMQLYPLVGPKVRLDLSLKRLLEAMEVPRPDEFISDTIPGELEQMIEIIRMTMGMPVAVDPQQNQMAHKATLADFMNSETGQALQEANPDAYVRLQEHAQQHDALMQQMQEQVAAAQQVKVSEDAPFDVGGGNPTPASSANEETAEDRMPVSAYPRGGGTL